MLIIELWISGHSFRRSSTTRRGNAIGVLFSLKRAKSLQSSEMAGAGSHPDKSAASKIISTSIASTIDPPSTSTKINSDSPACTVHCADESKIICSSKRSIREEQLTSSISNASNTNKKMRTCPLAMNAPSVNNISSKILARHRKSFVSRRRFVGNWKRSNMNSSILAKRFFDFAANSISKKNGALQHLRSENQRLTSRVEYLQNLLDQTKQSSWMKYSLKREV